MAQLPHHNAGADDIWPKRAQIRKARHAQQLADEYELLMRGDWLYCIEQGDDAIGQGKPYVTLFSYRGSDEHVVVPEEHDGLPVRALHNKVFYNLRFLKSVIMPDSIQQVGVKLFAQCRQLQSVRLSDALCELDPTMFQSCGMLRQIHLPQSLKVLESRLLYNCPIEVLTLPKSLVEVCDQSYCLDKLKRLEVDEENLAFSTDGVALYSHDGSVLLRAMVPVESYEVIASCCEIGPSAFKNCPLKDVTLPAGLDVIGSYAFFHTNLKAVSIPFSVRRIDDRAFFSCESLQHVQFAEGIEVIGDFVFARTALTQAQLPATLARLGLHSFQETEIDFSVGGTFCISEKNASLYTEGMGLYQRQADGLALLSMLGPAEQYNVVDGTAELLAECCAGHSELESVELPEGVSRIGNAAFKGCVKLREVHLPKTLARIGDDAFWDTALESFSVGPKLRAIGTCALVVTGTRMDRSRRTLKQIEVDPANSTFYVTDGLLCERSNQGDKLLYDFGEADFVRIPAQVNYIASMAFWMAHLQEIWVHKDVRFSAPKAFTGVSGLRRVHIEFPKEVDGFTSVTVEFPGKERPREGQNSALNMGADGSFFDFRAYDIWAVYDPDVEALAKMGLSRLEKPVKMAAFSENAYRKSIHDSLAVLCHRYARKRDMAAFERLAANGFINSGNIDGVVETAARDGEAEATGYLMEMKNRRFGIDEMDFSL